MDTFTGVDKNSGELLKHWNSLTLKEREKILSDLPRSEADRKFDSLTRTEQAQLLSLMSNERAQNRLLVLAPEDVVHILQNTYPTAGRKKILSLLSEKMRTSVQALFGYGEHEAGALMTYEFIHVLPVVSIEDAIIQVRRQISKLRKTIFYVYVLSSEQHLLGLVSFRELLGAPAGKRISEIMITPVTKVSEGASQIEVAKIFKETGYLAIPVVDASYRMKGIITISDIVDLVEGEATKNIQRSGGTEALDAPYLQVGFLPMFKKRVVWLSVLFVSEMFTATAMGFYEHELEKAVVLALFIPLIISSGGNSGSQASTLVVRALALKEIRLRDWWRILTRELGMGIALGAVLGLLGYMRILLWPSAATLYGSHYELVGMAVSLSLVSIVLWGSLIGSMLPMFLRLLSLDPAVACAPAVATIVDVSGLIIYFTTAKLVLSGTVL